jgi:hypothetical protein
MLVKTLIAEQRARRAAYEKASEELQALARNFHENIAAGISPAGEERMRNELRAAGAACDAAFDAWETGHA